jgi:hypothetical protein
MQTDDGNVRDLRNGDVATYNAGHGRSDDMGARKVGRGAEVWRHGSVAYG